MALTNCKKISDVSITVSKDQSLGSTDAVMFIDPIDSNYVVAASNFQNNTSGLSAYINTSNNSNGFVNGIKLSNTTTEYASDNRIRVDIDLLDTFSPSANVELQIDIDGNATHIDDVVFSISGDYYFATPSNLSITPSSTSYSVTGKKNEIKTLFTLTFTADTGYYLIDEPEYLIYNAGIYDSNYIFTAFDRQYTDGNLTSIKIKVEWNFLSQNFSGHSIYFSASVEQESTALFVIDNFTMDTSTIPQNGSVRNISITGTPGASFVFSITDGSSDTYNFADDIFDSTLTNLSGVLNEFGKFEQENIEFPASESKEKYQLSLQGGTAPASVTSVNGVENNDAFTWAIQAAELISISIDTESSAVSSLISSVQITNGSLIGERGKVYDDEIDTNLAPVDISIVINGSANLFLRKAPEFSTENIGDFSNTNPDENGGTLFSISNIQTSGDGTNQITISGKFSVNEVGSENVFSNLNLDNIINRAPSVNSTQSFTGQQGSEKIITLTGTDPENDPISFKITQDVTFGELYEETDVDLTSPISAPYSLIGEGVNKVRFKHDNSSNLSPVFKYKANDGFQDSNTECTVTGTLTATNDPPTANPQSATVNEFHFVAITLTGSDPEGETPIFKITSLPANGTLYKAIVFGNESTSVDPYGMNGVPAYYYNRQYNNTLYIQNANTVLGGTAGIYKLSSNTVIFGYGPASGSGYTSTTFGFKTSDGVNESAEATVTVTRNRAPVGTKLTETMNQNETKTITLTATDTENDSVDFYISSPLPSKGSLEDANGTRITNYNTPFLLPSADVVYKNNSNLSVGSSTTDIIKYYPIDEHDARGSTKTLNVTIDGPVPLDYTGTFQVSYQDGNLINLIYNNRIALTTSQDPSGEWFVNYASGQNVSEGMIVVGTGGAIMELELEFPNASSSQQASGLPARFNKDNGSFGLIDFRIFDTEAKRDAFNTAYQNAFNQSTQSAQYRSTYILGTSINNEYIRLSNFSTSLTNGWARNNTKSATGSLKMMCDDGSDGWFVSNTGFSSAYWARSTVRRAMVQLDPGTYYYGVAKRVWFTVNPAYTSLTNLANYIRSTIYITHMHPNTFNNIQKFGNTQFR